MTRNTARRLLLLFCCTAYVLALGAVWIWIAWALAVAMGLIGPLIAFIIGNAPVVKPLVEVADVGALPREDVKRLLNDLRAEMMRQGRAA